MVQPTRMLVAVLGLSCVFAVPMRAQEAMEGDFAYTGDHGPGFWKAINEDCATTPTSRQSPIDISGVKEDDKLEPLNLTLPELNATVTNNGHTIVADTRAGGGTLELDGRTYSLLGFHFHTLSEHTVEGQRGVMELHVVFQDSRDHFAVVGVLYRIGRRKNAFLERLIAAGLPQQTGSEPVEIKRLNVRTSLTDPAQYFRYAGSLTTPGCAPTVTWLVLKDWAELTTEQFESFRSILGNDFRPLQQRNDRVIRATKRRPGDDASLASGSGQQ